MAALLIISSAAAYSASPLLAQPSIGAKSRPLPQVAVPAPEEKEAAAPKSARRKDVLLAAMQAELKRSFRKLRHAEKDPLYYLEYEAWDTRAYEATAILGAIQAESDRHYRYMDVDMRIGDKQLDNTHQIKGRESLYDAPDEELQAELPVDDNADALRAEMWLRTNKDYKDALMRYTKVRTNKAVTAEEEDKSDDFSTEKPQTYYQKASFPDIDKAAALERVRRLSRNFNAYPFIFDSNVTLSVEAENRYIVNSEGSSVVNGNLYIRLGYRIATRTEDGMDLERSKNYDVDKISDLPSDEAVERDMERSIAELKALRSAPLVEPYTGPAIIRNRATGVFFHEILGHRLEGQRQKTEDEGQTFTKLLGKSIVAPFISVYDDPTLERLYGHFLRGYYKFDDEAVPAGRVTLIDKGLLRSFLVSRSPIKGFPSSNGHGRRSPGHNVVARMGNTIVEASETIPYYALREKLIAEIKRQKKPYGLILDDIAGGFTGTNRSGPQSFKVIPLLVWRVYPDGRPDEAVRGVDIVGTPLTSFDKIVAAADDYGVFDGTCGAESGWVPVSAVAPSVLVSQIEVEKKMKSSEKPPILPPPLPEAGK